MRYLLFFLLVGCAIEAKQPTRADILYPQLRALVVDRFDPVFLDSAYHVEQFGADTMYVVNYTFYGQNAYGGRVKHTSVAKFTHAGTDSLSGYTLHGFYD